MNLPQEPKAKRGAPRKYDRMSVMIDLLGEMAKGDKCLEAIIEGDNKYPHITKIYEWINAGTEEANTLRSIFTHAQELWCRAQLRKTIEIADDESRDYYFDEKGIRRSDNTAVHRDRNRILARHWAMAKLAPKVFGDKVTQEVTGANGGPIKYEEIIDRPAGETFEQWVIRVKKKQQKLEEEKR